MANTIKPFGEIKDEKFEVQPLKFREKNKDRIEVTITAKASK